MSNNQVVEFRAGQKVRHRFLRSLNISGTVVNVVDDVVFIRFEGGGQSQVLSYDVSMFELVEVAQ